METQTIRVNNKDINFLVEEEETYASIKDVCEAVGVDYEQELARMKKDLFLQKLIYKRSVLDKSGNLKDIDVLQLIYALGWVAVIEPPSNKNKELIEANKMDCYHKIYSLFPTKKDNARYFKCWKCGSKTKTDGKIPTNVCVNPAPHRTSGICGGSFTEIDDME